MWPVASPSGDSGPVVHSGSPSLLVVRDLGRAGHKVELMLKRRVTWKLFPSWMMCSCFEIEVFSLWIDGHL